MSPLVLSFSRHFCTKIPPNVVKMKYLNVAEKNDAAKTIAGFLSRGTSRRREGLSVYNKIYEFQTDVQGTNANMVMTSVSGHLLTHEFMSTHRNWLGCDPISLFDAPVRKTCPENFVQIKKTLEREIRSSNGLIIWTDCDREGENIGFEIIDVCRAIKPSIRVFRAKFSEITAAAVRRALANLSDPDERQSQAVDVRSELDLRIGAAFTRFQTLRFQRVFPSEIDQKLISYGSCQIPTLGFVTQRFKENENFIPQAFWKLKMTHTIEPLTVEFNWERHRLFDKQSCEAFLMICQADPTATVHNVTLKPKSKWRPLPMDTIQLEKLGSKWLKISAKQTMTIAEKLYQQGFISYPRTETNIFSNEIDLKSLVEQQQVHSDWGAFAGKVLEWGPNPRVGKKSDQAHPPIHPTKLPTNLSGDERKVYELVVRHFLACVSRDATASETIVNVRIANEEFTASGLCIHERNYLEVYIYEKWNSKEVHPYKVGDTFQPTELAMNEGTTTAPSMLTEAELIALMDKHGIGTDATHAEHINTIKERGYIGVIDRGFLVPGVLGMGLVEGYDAVDLPLAQPKLRAALERDLKHICTGQRNPQDVLQDQINIYREAFRIITQRAQAMDASMGNRLQAQPIAVTSHSNSDQPQNIIQEIFNCPKCTTPGSKMALKNLTQNNVNRYVLSCTAYPECKHSIWLGADTIKEAVATDEICPKCGTGVRMIKFTMKSVQMLSLLRQSQLNGLQYTSCIVCDSSLRDLLNIDVSAVKRSSSNAVTINRPNMPNANTVRQLTVNRNQSTTSRTTTTNRQNRPTQPLSSNRFNTNANLLPVSNSSSAWGSSNQSSTSTGNSRNTSGNSSNWPSGSNSSSTVNRTARGINQTMNSSPPSNTARSSSMNRTSSTATIGSTEDVKCSKCDQPARKLTVRKEGPNTGRQFYACKPECNFFQWADDARSNDTMGNSRGNNNSSWPSTSDGRSGHGSGRNRRTDDNDDGGEGRTKRKCGLCRQEGHTRKKCPRNL